MARVLGQQTFVAELTDAPGSGDTPLVIEGASTQTANLFLIEKSDGTDLFKVSPDGNITVAGTATITGAQTFTGAATFSGTLTVDGASTLTGNVTASGTLGVTGATTLAAVSATSVTATGTVAVTDTLTMTDAKNIVVASTTGTKIGTATTQKLAFYNSTPIVQPGAYTQTFATADKTHAAQTSADLVTTATTQTTPFGFASQAQGDAIATQVNALRVDLDDVKRLANSIIDDLQALGLVG